MNQDYDMVFKLLIIGNSSVGKSSLLYRFTDDQFSENFLPTIGVDFKIKTIQSSGTIVKLQIWDTAGQQRFKTITAAYYKGAQGIIFVFDLTDRKSFVDLENWISEAEKYSKENVVKILIGNKTDLGSMRSVSHEQAQKFASSLGMDYIETSVKQNQNIERTFFRLTQKVKQVVYKTNPSGNPKKPQVLIKPLDKKKEGLFDCWKMLMGQLT